MSGRKDVKPRKSDTVLVVETSLTLPGSAQDEMKRLIAKFLDGIDSFVENVNV